MSLIKAKHEHTELLTDRLRLFYLRNLLTEYEQYLDLNLKHCF